MRRELVTWSIVLGLIIVAFITTVLIVNSTLFSAGGFVRSYLGALARHDMASALQISDIQLPEEFGASSDDGAGATPIDTTGAGSMLLAGSHDLLRPSALSTLDDIELVDRTINADGTETVTFDFVLDGTASSSTFTVERDGTSFGVFADWKFVTPPLEIVRLTVTNSQEFSANGSEFVTPSFGAAAPYVVLTPSSFEISHTSAFLKADPIMVSAVEPGATVRANLEVVANEAMVSHVQREVNDYLDECATQVVLLPTGCPFGQPMSNRIVTSPEWSIANYPAVSLVPGSEAGTWLMPTTDAAAHLKVDVRSIFDGSVSTFDQDVDFTSSYLVTLMPDDELLVTEQFPN
ncbi:hypothetical protein ESZ53_09365 [Salinibacterium sp. UTAS2018]|uniref:hypothetical protein n=1 Tax=Salinibacterium sp. UTAS2018 TaxID=2508880 RepID=UPI00100950A9|nr:hypothetical protein [Salinibacterium sp. UTAS2018]QAV70627.1 hypothetical protein ESZ53_09365 [Salinibacterium sp. UTAS2018]